MFAFVFLWFWIFKLLSVRLRIITERNFMLVDSWVKAVPRMGQVDRICTIGNRYLPTFATDLLKIFSKLLVLKSLNMLVVIKGKNKIRKVKNYLKQICLLSRNPEFQVSSTEFSVTVMKYCIFISYPCTCILPVIQVLSLIKTLYLES